MAKLELQRFKTTPVGESEQHRIHACVEEVAKPGVCLDTSLRYFFPAGTTNATIETQIKAELELNGDYLPADLTPIVWLADVTE